MKSQIVIDDHLKAKIGRCCAAAKGSCGLLIGQV